MGEKWEMSARTMLPAGRTALAVFPFIVWMGVARCPKADLCLLVDIAITSSERGASDLVVSND